jgi:hypothetical protein
MAIFRTSPEKTLQRDRDAAKANVDRLAAKLKDAETAVIAAKTTVQAAALSGDDAALATAETAERAALHHLTTMRTANEAAGKLLALLESQIAELLDKKVRTATAAELAEMAVDLEQTNESVDIAMTALSKITARAGLFLFEAKGLEHFATSAQIQVPEASAYIAGLLRERARMVLDGSAPPTLPTPEAPYVAPVVVKPVTRRLFSLKPVSWTDANGDLRVAQRWQDVDLPLACADRAIAAKACVEMDNPARSTKTLRQWPGHPNPANCFNLDGDAAVKADAVDEQPREPDEVHSTFQPLDRGQPYQLQVAR